MPTVPARPQIGALARSPTAFVVVLIATVAGPMGTTSIFGSQPATAQADPVAVLPVYDIYPVPGDEVTFDASQSYDPEGQALSYAWGFDGDGDVDRSSTDPVVTHVYDELGSSRPSMGHRHDRRTAHPDLPRPREPW